jgi:hypothetical protein
MATFNYQKKELLKYYEKSDLIFNKHQRMFGDLITKLNSNKSLVREMVNNVDDFMKNSFTDFSVYCNKINENQLDKKSINYVFDLNKKEYLDKDSFPLDDKYIIRTNIFSLKNIDSRTRPKKKSAPYNWVVNNTKLNKFQGEDDNYASYTCSNTNINFYQGQLLSYPQNLHAIHLNQVQQTEITLVIDNYFNIYIPSLKTYYVNNYTAFPLYAFFINENKLNLYHDTKIINKRIIMYNQHNPAELKEYNEIEKFVKESNDYATSEDKRTLYKTEYYKYILDFYNYNEKLKYFEQFLNLSENFSNILPINTLQLTEDSNSSSLIEEEQKIFLQSSRIQELNLKLNKQNEELQFFRQERDIYIKTIGNKDIELNSRNKLINELNNNLKSKISELGIVERTNISLKTRLLKVDELDAKNNKLLKELNISQDNLDTKIQGIREQEIINKTLIDNQFELNDKLDILNKSKQDLLYKTTEHHLKVKNMKDIIEQLKLKCKTREKEVQLTQTRLDTVIQQLKSDENDSITKNGEYQQILLRQIKEKNDLLQKTTERNKSLELLYKKTENDFKSYKKKISRLVES